MLTVCVRALPRKFPAGVSWKKSGVLTGFSVNGAMAAGLESPLNTGTGRLDAKAEEHTVTSVSLGSCCW